MQIRKFLLPMIILTAGCAGGNDGKCTEASVKVDSVMPEADSIPVVDMSEIPAPDSFFFVTEVSDSVFKTMEDVSFKRGAPVKRADLREVWVLHHDFEGEVRQGLIICHKDVAKDIVEVFRELYEIGYPIQSIMPVDNFGGDDNESMRANNTSCFNFRPTPGGSRLSYHAYGTAIDINPLYNPYVRKTRSGTVVLPEEGKAYSDRSTGHKGMIMPGDECVAVFKKHGFSWGGDWRRSTRDYQHFEKRLKR